LNIFNTYQVLTKGVIALLLVGQVWTNTVSICYTITEDGHELVEFEFPGAEDNDTEKDEKEKEEKLQTSLTTVMKFNLSSLTGKADHLFTYFDLHHPEITTPPPRAMFFNS